jgi:hypothetical protein
MPLRKSNKTPFDNESKTNRTYTVSGKPYGSGN